MKPIDNADLKTIFQCIFGFSLLILAVQWLRPDRLTNSSKYVATHGTPYNSEHEVSESPPQKILFWTLFFSQEFDANLSHRIGAQEELDACPVKCIFTHDPNEINDSAAVIFHIRDLWPHTRVPAERIPGQYYIFYLLESPMYTQMDLATMENFFNYTFTYRLDSDIPAAYYHRQFSATTWRDKGEFERLWRRKTDFAAVYMSFCSGASMRSIYLNELSRLISVDIFGSCGPGLKSCDSGNKTYCDGLVSTYKFYLAFENSVCKDYITEKVYRALNHGTVPVVYGGANYTAMLPPNSFLNILDFKDPQALADRLLFLANNPLEYAKYLQWRYNPEYTTMPDHMQPEKNSWCRLCKMLTKKPPPKHTVDNLEKWWNIQDNCAFPTVGQEDGDLKWINNPSVNFT